ncbi:hypothetical protein A2615_03140 [Candidatus Curtissbacteria bacterium RIFOXYD1_FULL_41_36]|nr:MAG: hypothetical protein UU19_C0037G0004 [Candidatus Curtissbacteria bacterium GW2011_GWD1_40_8]KKS01321.1 MAG: hypothetical protein UU53_C0014G0008 [Candidatus Curtissbacteria bacterium GW2011_GWC2_41_21]OGD78438.1 MAG: hypothetical protein A2683_01415 [Candidatus Curtissbacteria bacterium RIFCSPHIGHO2_01_FULL_34_40]OGE07478.1 MAG: hypothetical protein A2615_03140 [Candidatus Curtissbacteria bacterium RIFOXYD1_FULL_41_36]OGE09692.1 MAG: hypothetical protein A2470_00985 [Candidatus Curtissb
MERKIPGTLEMNPFKHAFAEVILWWKVRKGLTIKGAENLEEARKLKMSGAALIFLPNHLSNFDAPILDYSLRKLGYTEIAGCLYNVQGSVLSRNLITKILVTCYNVIPIPAHRIEAKDVEKRRREKSRAHNAAKTVYRTNRALCNFVQGTRSEDGKLDPEKVNPNNEDYLEMAENTWIVPVGISGSEGVLKKRSFWPHKHPVTINFGKPVSAKELIEKATLTLTDLEREEDPEKVKRLIMADIMGRIAALLPEEYR